MDLSIFDISVFLVFIGFVVTFSMYKSRHENTGEDFFLASRSLTWPLIGFSLIAANISTEQFVGMNGAAAGDIGMAIASYDWIAAISLVLVAIFFLPLLLRGGIYTIPEYLEHRYNSTARGIMSFYMMLIYVTVTITAVLYSGGLTLRTIFDMDLRVGMQVALPLIIVLPGIMAVQLYQDQLTQTSDAAFPLMIRNLIPTGLRGFIFAAIAGAVISSLGSMLNSASTIFTIDIFKRHFKKDASPHSMVTVGRIATLVFVVIGCLIAPIIDNPKFQGVFNFIQDFQGYVTPGILACFLFGFIIKRTPAAAAITGLLINVPVYGTMHITPDFLIRVGLAGKIALLDKLAVTFGQMAFLNKMAVTFFVITIAMLLVTVIKPLKEPRQMPVNPDIDMKPAPSVVWLGCTIILATIVLYVIFW